MHELLRRLRRAYGKYALFFADDHHADCIAVVWLPTMAAPGTLSVSLAENTFPLILADQGSAGLMGGGGESVVPDTVGMLCGFRRLGDGLIREVEVLSGARVVT